MRTLPRYCRSASIFAALAASLAASADAATLYVDGNVSSSGCTNYDPASRSCGGGSATAYSRIVDTFTVVGAGDTVLIRAGTYNEPERVFLTYSGRSDAPLEFRAYPGEAVRVQGPHDPQHESSTISSPFDFSGRDFITVDGLEIAGYGIAVRLVGSSNITLTHLNLHECGHGVWVSGGSRLINVADLVASHISFRDGGAAVHVEDATDVLVERASASFDIGDPAVGAEEGDGFHVEGAGANIVFRDCVSTDNDDDGFDFTAAEARIERSIAARNVVGFKLWDEHCDPSNCPSSSQMNHYTLINVVSWANAEAGLFAQNGPNLEMYNSAFVGNTEGVRLAQSLDVFPDPVAAVVMQNDLIVGNSRWGRRFESAGADNTGWTLTSDHNVFWNNGNGNAVWTGEDPSTLEGDPLFAAENAGDFHLQPGSPAIDTGRDLSAIFATDFDGLARPAGSGWDRGPYESGATTASDAGTTVDAGESMDSGTTDSGTMVVDAGTTADASRDASVADVRASTDAREGGSPGDASVGDVVGDAESGGMTRGGCGCRAAGGMTRGRFAYGILALVALATRRRRRVVAT